jgi:hypothetical protein
VSVRQRADPDAPPAAGCRCTFIAPGLFQIKNTVIGDVWTHVWRGNAGGISRLKKDSRTTIIHRLLPTPRPAG